MRKAVIILLCLAVWVSMSMLPRISYECDDEPGVRMARPCCPEEKPPQRSTWDARCCEIVSSAVVIAPCTPPSASRLLGDAPPAVIVALVPAPLPPRVLARPRCAHSGIPPGSGLRLLNTTVQRI